MQFNEKINSLIEELDITNSEFAKACGLGSSFTSRLKTGKRIPLKNSNTLIKLSEGFEEIIIQKGKKDYYLSHLNNGIYLRDKLYNYFNEDLHISETKIKNDNKKFSINLAKIMALLDINNSSLAIKLNVDASLISKYKTGVRVPAVDSGIANNMVNFFAKLIIQNNKVSDFSSLLNITLDDNSIECIKSYMFSYLFDDDDKYLDNIKKILESIDNATIPCLVYNSLQTTNKSISDMYYGESGFQDAIIRFLNEEAVYSSNESLLFSNQDINGMFNDANFVELFKYISLSKKITIALDINNNSLKLFNTIENFIPFCLTGNVQLFYNKFNDELFKNTILIGNNAVCGFCLEGYKQNGIYKYIESRTEIDNLKNNYKNLLSISKPLMHVYKSIDDFINSHASVKPIFKSETNLFNNLNIKILNNKTAIIQKSNAPTAVFVIDNINFVNALLKYIQSNIN